jgi:hypothetical protein
MRVLAVDRQGLPAGSQYPKVRAGPQQRIHGDRTRIDQMLAIVQQHQQLAVPQMLPQRGNPERLVQLTQ